MKRHLNQKSFAGFTLIELLSVIAIVGVLVAILIPVISTVRERGNEAKCVANLRQLGIMFHLYSTDNQMRLPKLLYWGEELVEGLGAWDTKDLWRCPSDKVERPADLTWPRRPDLAAWPRSYYTNPYLYNLWGQHPFMPGHRPNTPISLQNVQNPSRVWLLTEYHPTEDNLADLKNRVVGVHAGSLSGGAVKPVHGETVNVLMLDGHVESLKVPDKSWWIAHYFNPN